MVVTKFRVLAIVALICAMCTYRVSAQTTVIDLSKNGADQIWQGGSGVANTGFWFDQGELGIGDNRKDLIIGAPGVGAVGHVFVTFGVPVASGTVNISPTSDVVFTASPARDGFGWNTTSSGESSLDGLLLEPLDEEVYESLHLRRPSLSRGPHRVDRRRCQRTRAGPERRGRRRRRPNRRGSALRSTFPIRC